MRTVFATLLLAAFVLTCGLVASPTDLAAGPDDKREEAQAERVRQLIDQLGAEEFKAREAATRELQQIGKPALPALRRAAETTDDPEVRSRAQRVIEAVEGTPEPEIKRPDLRQPGGRSIQPDQLEKAMEDALRRLRGQVPDLKLQQRRVVVRDGVRYDFSQDASGKITVSVTRDGKATRHEFASLEAMKKDRPDLAKVYGDGGLVQLRVLRPGEMGGLGEMLERQRQLMRRLFEGGDLQKELERSRKEFERLMGEGSELQKELEKMRGMGEGLREEAERARRQMEHALGRGGDLRDQLERHRQRLQRDLQQLDVESLRREIEQLRQLRPDLKRPDLKREVERLRGLLPDVQELRRELERMAPGLDQLRDELEQTMRQHRARGESLRRRLERLRSRDRGLQDARPSELSKHGLAVSRPSEALMAQLGLESGVVIDRVDPDSGFPTYGLRRHDIVVAVDGKPVRTAEQFFGAVAITDMSAAKLTVVRRGQRIQLPDGK